MSNFRNIFYFLFYRALSYLYHAHHVRSYFTFQRLIFQFFILCCLFFTQLSSDEVPTLWKWRIRPIEVTAAEWCREMNITTTDPVAILWQAHVEGLESFRAMPIFHLPSGNISSYEELPASLNHENLSLLITGAYAEKYLDVQNHSGALKLEIFPSLVASYQDGKILLISAPERLPWKIFKVGDTFIIDASLEKAKKEYSKVKNGWFKLFNQIALYERWRQPSIPQDGTAQELLTNLQDPLAALPQRNGSWIGLRALQLPLNNFTAYTNENYTRLRNAYTSQQDMILPLLAQSYLPLAGTLHYPTLGQLKAEKILSLYPWYGIVITLYLLSTFFLFRFPKSGTILLAAAFFLHSLLLLLRWYILDRPPVSNMAETLIYVPWIAALLGWVLYNKDRSVKIAAALTAGLLLLCLPISQLETNFENVQAVLNSQYWLTIHVLMVVGSYGAFFLAGALAHFYLVSPKRWAGSAAPLLTALYIGTGLLIAGTLLGGVWAAQSWGRFWDWDPKESWAFISACFYLILVHAVRFRWISSRGVAIGAIIGLLFVSFTWYGVNYVLGTGLHSYGFGSGGETLYLGYIAIEIIFLLFVSKKVEQKTLSKT